MHFLYLNLLSTVRGRLQHWQKGAKIVWYLCLTFIFIYLVS